MKTIVLNIVGMHCTSCALSIDLDLEDLSGVKEAKTSYGRQTTTVTFDQNKVSEVEIMAVIKKLNYDTKVNKESLHI